MRKKLFLAATMALAMTAFAAPAFAADATVSNETELANAINNAATGDTITLANDIDIASTLTIDDGITINGNGKTITYSGNGSALSVTAQEAVVLNDVDVTAASSGAYAISLTSSQPDLTLTDCVINANNRGINMYPSGGCEGGKLVVSDTDINNTQITDYVNQTTVGDTRGIALFDVKNSSIKIENGSSINGFGYCVNVSGTLVNGIRDGQDTKIEVTNSAIQGWSAFNVWSCNMTFDLTNSTFKGINRLDSEWNNFATIVMNNGIYNGNAANANVVNIKGGNIQAYAFGTAGHCDFLETSECMTQYNFSTYNNAPVYCYYVSGQSVFAVSYPGGSPIINGANNIVQLPVSVTN